MTDISSGVGSRIVTTPQTQTTDSQSSGIGGRFTEISEAVIGSDGLIGEKGVSVSKGDAQHPPTDGGKTHSAKQKVGDFFKAIGTGIANGFRAIGGALSKGASAIGNFFASLTAGRTEEPADPRGPKPPRPDKPAYLNTAGGPLAEGVEKGGLEGVKEAITNLLDTATLAMWEHPDTEPQDISAFVAKKFDPQGKDGFALIPSSLAKLEGHMEALRTHFEDNVGALAILDQVGSYDFNTSMQQEFTKIVDKLKGGDNPVGSFMRGNSFVSAALKALSAESFDPKEFGETMLAQNSETFADIREEWSTMDNFSRGKERLTGEIATTVIAGAANYIDQLTQVEGEGGIRERFGGEILDRLTGLAEQIADRDDIPADVRNGAIEKLYIDQLFLRGGVTAMTVAVDKQSPEFSSVMVALSAINGAKGGKFEPEMANLYGQMSAGVQTQLHESLVAVGMPVVAE